MGAQEQHFFFKRRQLCLWVNRLMLCSTSPTDGDCGHRTDCSAEVSAEPIACHSQELEEQETVLPPIAARRTVRVVTPTAMTHALTPDVATSTSEMRSYREIVGRTW